MKSCHIYTLESLVKSQDTLVNVNDKWVPARPIGFTGFAHRIKMAWYAFTGKCDLVKWPEGQ